MAFEAMFQPIQIGKLTIATVCSAPRTPRSTPLTAA